MLSVLRYLAVFLIIGGTAIASVHSAAYYVDAINGNDAWTGRLAAPSAAPAQDGPWQSLHKVGIATLAPGDTIMLKCGQTWYETLKLKTDGTATMPITVTSNPVGCSNKPVIDGSVAIPSKAWAVHAPGIYAATLPLDLLVDTPLSGGASGWGVYAANRDATLITTNDCGGGAPPCLTAVGGTVGSTILYSRFDYQISLNPSATYTLRFRVKAAPGVRFFAAVRRAAPPWEPVGLYQAILGTGNWESYSFDFSVSTSLQNARVDFDLPPGRPAVSVDDVNLVMRNNLLLGLFSGANKMVQAHHPNAGHDPASPNSVYLHAATDSPGVAGGGSSYVAMGSDMAKAPGLVAPGQTIRVRSRPWVLDERIVRSVVGNTVTLDQPTSFPLVAGSGYYFTGALWMLDEPGEWHYDSGSGKLYVWMPDGQAPGQRVSFSSLPRGVDMAGRSNVVVDSIVVRKTGVGVSMRGSVNVTLRNSVIADTTREGIDISNAIQGRIESNTLEKTGGDAIARVGGDTTTGMRIVNNRILQSGLNLQANGQLSLPMPSSAAIQPGPQAIVTGNVIQQSSYHGIVANGASQVNDNIVQSTCMLLDDCGGIYAWGAGNNSTISGNLVTGITGNPYGMPQEATHVVGIYLDELTSGVTVSGNTVAEADYGIQLHDAASNQILNNTLYGNRDYQVWLQEGSRVLNAEGDIHSNVVRGNLLFPTNTNPGLSLDTQFSTTHDFASFDGNVYSALNSANVVREQTASSEVLYGFPAWRAAMAGSTPRQLEPNGRQVAQVGYTSFAMSGANLLGNGDLSSGTTGWSAWDSVAPRPQMILESSGNTRWLRLVPGGLSSLVFPGHFSVVQGRWYRLTFDLKTKFANQKVVIMPRRGGGGTNGYELVTNAGRYVLGQPTWKRYTLAFQATLTVNQQDRITGDSGARVDFQQIHMGEEISLANVEVVQMEPVGTTLETALLTNPTKSNLSVSCPTATISPGACTQFVRFTDGARISWPYTLLPLRSEIVYTQDQALVDSDSDGIADIQDSCPVSVQPSHIDARCKERHDVRPLGTGAAYVPASTAALGFQRCGSSSSMRDAGWPWMRASTSRR